MLDRMPRWLASVLRRAPMGLIQSATFIVGGGALILAGLVIPSAAHALMWLVWWIALPFGVLLFMRGVIGAAGLMVQQGWFVTSQVQRRGLPRVRIEWPDPEEPPREGVMLRDPIAADLARTHVGTYDGDLVPRAEPLPPPNPAADADSDILDVTPEALVALFEGKTDLQGQAAVKGYIGERMRVSGTLDEVHGSDRLNVRLQRPTAMSWLYFGSEWTDHLAKLSTGDAFEVVGRIESVHRDGVSLENCQLVRSSV